MATSTIRLLLRIFALAVVILLGIVLLRTFTLTQRAISAPACKPYDSDFIRGDKNLIGRFQQALRFQTVSHEPHEYNRDELQKIRDYIIKTYPVIHSSSLVKWEVVANYSLLYEVHGTDKALKPFMLTGHLDVVPVNRAKWEQEPFGGDIVDGFIYGRGTIDDKHTVFGILEALEFLLKSGHKPRRSFFVGFGHDEEVGGGDGARAIGAMLQERGVQLEFLMDEGLMVVTDGVVPGVTIPVALVGSSEKGSVTLEMSVNVTGGHSAIPEGESSIGILARAVIRLETNPHPSMFGTGPEKGMFEHIAPSMTFPLRMVMSNLWLFSPLVSWFMSMKPVTNALSRTTTAVTRFNAGMKDNVIAPSATVVVNHRIHPSQTVAEVVEFDRQIVNDPRVHFVVKESLEGLPKSPYGDEHFGWQTIKTSILQIWGSKQTIVAPGLTVGNTDTCHYIQLTRNIYRFSPSVLKPSDLPRFHGDNERISVQNYEEAVNFFYHLMRNADKPELEPLHEHGTDL